jgi:glyoxylase-like metal-dependent hydrolase (beta-lactamase superfamily II)
VPLPELGPRAQLAVVPTPGHIDDHHCLHLPERGWLFTADLFVARRRVYYRKDEDATTELASLRRVLALDFDTVLCAHRGVVTEGKRALADRVAFMEEVRARTLALRADGLSDDAIRARLLGREGLMRYFTLGDFSKHRFIATLR